jgi:hypothetical protein
MMADDNSDEMMCSIIAAMIARRKREQTMTDVNNNNNNDDDDDDDEDISPRDVRSFTFDTTTTKEDNKGEDETVVIKKGDNDDDAAATAKSAMMADDNRDEMMCSIISAMIARRKQEQTMTDVNNDDDADDGEEYAITFLHDVLRHTVTFTENAYSMRVQEWDVARALEFYYNEKGEFSIDDYDNEEEDDDDDDTYDNEEEDDDDDTYDNEEEDDDDDSQYTFDESSTGEDEDKESMSDNHEETMAEVNDINLTTTTLTKEIKDFKDYLINPIFVEFNADVEMEIKGIVMLRNALIDYLTGVQKCDVANKEEDPFLLFSATEDDILFGRGGDINKHPGNVRFQEKARELAPSYVACGGSKEEKYKVSELLVDCMKAENRRFLEKGSDGLYYEVVGNDVMKKASQALREVDIDSVTHNRLVAATSNESSTTNVPSNNTIL